MALIAVGAARSGGDFGDGAWAAAWRAGHLGALAFLVAVGLVMGRRPATVSG